MALRSDDRPSGHGGLALKVQPEGMNPPLRDVLFFSVFLIDP